MHVTNRRDFLKAIGVVGVTLAVGTELVRTAEGDDEFSDSWTTFRGNSGRTGATAASGPGPNATTEWTFDMDGGMYTAEPVVADGTMYLAVTTAHTPSESEGYVAAYDPEERATVWKREGISRPGTPTLGDGTVYFQTYGSEDADASGFFAVDSESGETKWHESDSFGLSDSLVADGRLFAKRFGDACQLDPETGDVLWKTEGVSGGMCHADGTLFYGGGIALNADDGSVLWDASDDEDELRTVVDGSVYGVVNGGESGPAVIARSTEDGAVRWSHSLGIEGFWWGSQLTVTDERVCFRIGNTIVALDAKSGDEAWTYETNTALAGALSAGDGTLYAGGRTNPETDTGGAVVIAVDLASGELEWDHVLGGWEFDDYGPAALFPVVADGKVYTATYPMGSTLDWTYTEYGDVHVLGSGGTTTTTSEETTAGETTTSETTNTETTTNDETSTSETTVSETTTGGETTTAGSTTDATTTGTTTDATTTGANTTTSQTSETMTTSATGNGSGTTTTTGSDGQPGFGFLTAIGGVAGVGAYLRAKIDGDD